MDGTEHDPETLAPGQNGGMALVMPQLVVDPSLTEPCDWERLPPGFEGSNLLEQQRFDTSGIGSSAGFRSGSVGQVMDLLSMNWMSPEYPNSVDWNGLLAGTAQINMEPSLAMFPFSSTVNSQNQHRSSMADFTGPWLPISDQPQVIGKEPKEAREMQPSLALDPATYNSPMGDHSVNESWKTDSTEASCYVDGDESRAPFRGQSTLQRMRRAAQPAGSHALPLPGHIASHAQSAPSSSVVDTLVTEVSYNNMVQHICMELSDPLLLFDSTQIPSHPDITELVQLYFDNFNPVFPFLRKSDFANVTSVNWILLLAVAAVGEKYRRKPLWRSSRGGLIQLLETVCSRLAPNIHRGSSNSNMSSWTPQHDGGNAQFDLPTLQAVMLNLICIIHSGKTALIQRAFIEKHYLVAGCNGLNLLSPSSDDLALSRLDNLSEAGTQDWLNLQARNRTGLMIWVSEHMTRWCLSLYLQCYC